MEAHETSPESTPVTYTYLKTRCAAAGTTLKALCEEAGIHPQTLTAWKHREPKSIARLNRLKSVLDRLEEETRAARV